MTPTEQLILEQVSSLHEEIGELRREVRGVSDIVRGWRGQLVKQGGLVAIALVTAVSQTCAYDARAVAPAPTHGTAGAGGEGGHGGAP